MRSPLTLQPNFWMATTIHFLHLLTADCSVQAAEGSLATIDLTSAAVVVSAELSPREMKAVSMLVEEVAKRSQIQWYVSHEWPK